MERNNLKAVIFDLDGVITDSAKYHYLASVSYTHLTLPTIA